MKIIHREINKKVSQTQNEKSIKKYVDSGNKKCAKFLKTSSFSSQVAKQLTCFLCVRCDVVAFLRGL
jgi:hypothetical protein